MAGRDPGRAAFGRISRGRIGWRATDVMTFDSINADGQS
jgi:hypothetical protein